MVGVSVNIIELAQGMSENFYAMNNTTDDEARDFGSTANCRHIASEHRGDPA